jgi:hypothetical protein
MHIDSSVCKAGCMLHSIRGYAVRAGIALVAVSIVFTDLSLSSSGAQDLSVFEGTWIKTSGSTRPDQPGIGAWIEIDAEKPARVVLSWGAPAVMADARGEHGANVVWRSELAACWYEMKRLGTKLTVRLIRGDPPGACLEDSVFESEAGNRAGEAEFELAAEKARREREKAEARLREAERQLAETRARLAAAEAERLAALRRELRTRNEPGPRPENQPAILWAPRSAGHSARVFDGHWFSPDLRYGYRLRDGIGIASSTGSPKFKVGQVIVRIRATGPRTFEGEQIYGNGQWYRIRGELRPNGRLYIAGEKDLKWFMTRTEP